MSSYDVLFKNEITNFYKSVEQQAEDLLKKANNSSEISDSIKKYIDNFDLISDFEGSARRSIGIFHAPSTNASKKPNISYLQDMTNRAGKSIMGNKAVLIEALAQKKGIIEELKIVPEIKAFAQKGNLNDSAFISFCKKTVTDYSDRYTQFCNSIKALPVDSQKHSERCLSGLSLNDFIASKIQPKFQDPLCIGATYIERDSCIKGTPGAPFFKKSNLISKVNVPLLFDFKTFSGLMAVGSYNDGTLFDRNRDAVVNLMKDAMFREKDLYEDIYYFDTYMYNADALGEFSFLTEGSESYIKNVPLDEKSFEEALSNIKLSFTSVRPDGKKKYLFVFNGCLNHMQSNALSVISWLVATAKTNNFTIIVLYEKERNQSSTSGQSDLILRNTDVDIFGYKEDDYQIRFPDEPALQYEPLKKSFSGVNCRDWKKTKAKVDNKYNRNSMNYSLTSRKIKPIVFGVDPLGNDLSFDLNGFNFSTYIVGSAGSGKSNLIQIIISELVQNNHPDFLEIWFVDFGNSAMAIYKDEDIRPPHVKNIILDDSPVMMCSVIESLHKILKERQLYLSRQGVEDLKDLSTDIYMPAILVIFDEFSRMVNSLPDCEYKYTSMLMDLFSQGRKYGLKFIIANQEFGIPASGKDREQIKGQIKNRIGLFMDEKSKLNDLFDLPVGLSDQDKSRLNSIQPFHALQKKTEQSGGNWLNEGLVFFSEDSVKHRVLEDVVDYFSPVSQKNWKGVADGKYVNRKVRIVDPGAEPTFREYRSAMIKYNSEHADGVNLFPGMPKTIEPAVPIVLQNDIKENILIFGGAENNKGIISVYSALTNSIKMLGGSIILIAGKNSAFASLTKDSSDGESLAMKINNAYAFYKKAKKKGVRANKLIFISGLEKALERIELYEEEEDDDDEEAADGGDPYDFMKKFNFAAGQNSSSKTAKKEKTAKDMIKEVIKFGSDYGVNVVLVTSNVDEVNRIKSPLDLEANMFRHKLIFKTSRENASSLDCSLQISKFVAALSDGCFRYDNGIPAETLEYRAFS